MRRHGTRVGGWASVLALAFGGAGCGGDRAADQSLTWLTALPSPQDPASMFVPSVDAAVHRSLYAITLGAGGAVGEPIPDLAAGPAVVSGDGRSVTVTLRAGIRFAPPVGRVVTSRDVRHAIERAHDPRIGSAGAYLFGDLVGADAVQAGRTRRIAGIETPDDRTLVFRLRSRRGALLARRLASPVTAPVPEEYARRFDGQTPSVYARHAVGTGPYAFERDASGRIRESGRRVRLLPNPNWDAASDFRPAPLREVVHRRVQDADLAARQTIRRPRTVCVCFARPATVRRLSREAPDRVASVPVPLVVVLTMNTRLPPLDRVEVRRAVMAAIDRSAFLRVNGGEHTGTVATGLIPHGVLGFSESSSRPPEQLRAPGGDLRVARRHLRSVGSADGRYGDRRRLRLAFDNVPAGPAADLLRARLGRLGLRIDPRVLQGPAARRACGTPSTRTALCVQAFSTIDGDPELVLGPAFAGRGIRERDNPNFAQIADPALDAAIERAAAVAEPRARARAWAEVNRLLLDRAAAVPLVWARNTVFRSADVRGLVSPDTGFFDLAWMRAG